MSPHEFDLLMLACGGLLLLAVGAVRASSRLGLPSLLAYLGLGVALGESGAGVRFDDTQLAQNLGLTALVLILAEGGLSAEWREVRRALPVAAALSTVGVAVSLLITAGAVHLLLGFEWRLALLLGAVVAPTDAAAIFATLRGLPLRRSLTSVLEVESGTNDPVVVILVVALSSAGGHGVGYLVLHGALEVTVGAAVGAALGWAGGRVLRVAALPSAGLYPLAVLATTVVAYGVAALLAGSGFLAVYVAASVLGRDRLPHQQATRAVVEGLGWLSQIGLFVMLGLLVSPSELGPAVVPALVTAAVLLLVARPVSVAASTWWRLRPREQAFVSWAGLRGAVPIVLATIPVTRGVEGADGLIELVFLLIVVLTLLQGSTLPRVADRLGALDVDHVRDLRVESAPLESLSADLLETSVPAGSGLQGVTIRAIRLPVGASISLVVRDGQAFVPGDETVLRTDDRLVVVASESARLAAESRLRAVSRRGDLAGWFGESGRE